MSEEGPSCGAGERRLVLLDFLFRVLQVSARREVGGERKVSSARNRKPAAQPSCHEWVGLVARQLTAPTIEELQSRAQHR